MESSANGYPPLQALIQSNSPAATVGVNPNDYIMLEKDNQKMSTLKGCCSARDQNAELVDHHHKKYKQSLYEQAKLTQQKVSKKYNSTFDPILHLLHESDYEQQPPISREDEESDVNSSVLTISILDWNDKDQIERHIIRQIERQRAAEVDSRLKTCSRGVPLRMSEYFGALEIEELNEEDEPHQKLNCTY